jgi:transcription elongation factor/antiterminator RfaH
MSHTGQGPTTGPSFARPPGCLQLGEQERWYVIRSQPRKEGFAVANLNRQGFRTFLPRLTRTVRHARKARTVLAPLFPGYLFTPLDPDRRQWRPINGTFGVLGLIMEGDRPQPVPPGVVEAILALAAAPGSADWETVDWGQRLAPGGRVRILTGPFADQLGTLRSLDDHGRAKVLLEIMGASRTLTLESRTLLPA